MAVHDHDQHDRREAVMEYWRTIRSRKYVILAVFALGCLIAAIVGQLLPPVYRATARILVEDRTPQVIGVQRGYPAGVPGDRYYWTQTELIKSRPVLRAAAARLRLDSWEGFADEKDPVGALVGTIEVRQVPRTQLIDVSFEGSDRTKVADAANAIVECFRQESIRRDRQSSHYATGWIEEQLPRLRAEVIAAEKRLQAFQEEHRILSLDRTHDIMVQRLEQLSRDVAAAERERINLETALAQVEAAGVGPQDIEFLPLVADSPAVRGLDSQILSLESRRIDLLQSVTPEHPDVRTVDSKIAVLSKKRRQEMQRALSKSRSQLGYVRAKEQALRTALDDREKKVLELNEKRIRLSALQREVAHAKELYEPLLTRSQRLDLTSRLDADPVQIVNRAEEPLGPVKPRKKWILAAGALLGLLAGLRLAFLLERAQSKVRAPADLARVAGLRTVGVMPHMSVREEKKRFLACHHDPRSATAEAYRSLRTNLLLSAAKDGATVLLVTSPLEKEGKTTIATNVASALAQSQKKVLVVDADLRRPMLKNLFHIEKGKGLSSCLSDGLAADETVQPSDLAGFSVVPAGPSADNPSELLGSPRMADFLEWARKNFDYVVLDSPPLNIVTDASVLTSLVDGVLLVVRANTTPYRALAQGRELLENAKAELVGAVLNDMTRRPGEYGYGRYYYYYGRPRDKT